MKYLKIIFKIAFLLNSYSLVNAQELTVINGKVLNFYDNKPIEGATIVFLPSKFQTTTDSDGAFAVELTEHVEMITVSFVGYKTIQIIYENHNSDLLFHLESENNQLTDVLINTGYQRIPKERATGSFELISNQSINRILAPDILSRLEGNSSLLFDKDPRRPGITLRGIGTIEGNTDPLIIVDDFPYEGDISSINPDIVENVSILKDAAAASIWGARAANGVIVITTKRGTFNQTPKISFNSTFQHVSKPDLNYYQLISSRDLIEVEKFLFENEYYKSSETNLQQPYLSPVIELLIQNRDNLLNNDDLQAKLDYYSQIDNRDQYSKYMYRNGQNQQYSLDISGGLKNFSYYIFSGFDKNIDNLSAKKDRYSFQANANSQVSNKVNLSTKIYFVQSSSKNGHKGYSPHSFSRPYLNLLNEEGEDIPHYRIRKSFAENAGEGLLMDWAEYPLKDALHDIRIKNTQILMGSLGVNYKMLDGLDLGALYRFEDERGGGENIRGVESYYSRDLINLYTTINPVSEIATYNIPIGDMYDLENTRLKTHNARVQATFNKGWMEHRLDMVLGGEIRSLNSIVNYTRDYGYDPNRYVISKVDYVNPVKDFITGRNLFIPFVNDYKEKQTNFVSQFLNVAYNYKNKYTISLSGRRDGSNQFGLATNDKWNPLWSTGLLWNMSNESFYSFDVIPMLKLRATYGVTGNLDFRKTAVPIIYYQGVDNFSGKLAALISQPANPQLRWEKNKVLNLAIDFESYKGILEGSVEYYTKKGIDLFGPSSIDISTGLGTVITKNVASMKGKGIDARVSIKGFNSDLKSNTQILFSYSESKVSDYYIIDGNMKSSNYLLNGTRISPIVGYPLYPILSYPWMGLNKEGKSIGKFEGEASEDYLMIMNADATNLVNSGSGIPTKFGSISNLVEYKNVSLNFNILYKLGSKFRRTGFNSTNLFSLRDPMSGLADYPHRWKEVGDENKTDVPAMIYPSDPNSDAIYTYSEILVESGDHIRLQNINIGYNIKNLEGMNVNVFANFSNLGILWKANKKDIDPDYQIGLPAPKSYSLGFKINY